MSEGSPNEFYQTDIMIKLLATKISKMKVKDFVIEIILKYFHF